MIVMSIVNEEWRSIDGHMNYQVSNLGRVRDANVGRILHQTINNKYGYACLRDGDHIKPYGVHKLVAHEFLGKPENIQDLVIDHIDRDKSNNRLVKWRYATRSQNAANSVRNRENLSSKYKGVCRHRHRWQSSIKINGKYKHLGLFDTEEDAARKYNEKALEVYGEYAYLNEVI